MLAPWPATVAMLAGSVPSVPRRWPATRTRRVLLWDDVGKPRAARLSRCRGAAGLALSDPDGVETPLQL